MSINSPFEVVEEAVSLVLVLLLVVVVLSTLVVSAWCFVDLLFVSWANAVEPGSAMASRKASTSVATTDCFIGTPSFVLKMTPPLSHPNIPAERDVPSHKKRKKGRT